VIFSSLVASFLVCMLHSLEWKPNYGLVRIWMEAVVIYFEGIIYALVRRDCTNPSYVFVQTNEFRRIYKNNHYTAA
jgi:hypothetical protein